MDIKALFGQMDQAREKIEAVKKELDQLIVTKETGAGLVKVTVSGDKKLRALSIDESLLNKADKKMVEELIVGAANLALEEIDYKTQEVMQQHAGLL
ncbi:MAG: YbaB/EbfC family nucleoid-associated protein [Candidatus Cardinium sp.]|uniref:YbaB/EbfC family nucleoid-associated protein n=1 Tax=Cardinium endosymbiont of Dermatophagoides farinae TaxID=2597823 RepID=UPI001181EF6A|nr:YbaB/EbfC family nucleoid-associated protein [Cardinium endosymbiont of Dermatophagoides farinae]TSJ80947.1 YbaB/EbfC family nucleoid-associated protein [Cardinium endosymbiont of Dermatophagoides farinae]UWW96973.1 MAG: YbaB/EbfC family nucleoid-associated protein [Candidatus Cardinium sp.]